MGDQVPGWRMVGASVPGVSHVRSGQPCQDAHLWRETAAGTLIAAVADGAGSAPLAELGSACAVRVVVEEAAARLQDAEPAETQAWVGLLQGVFEYARQAVEAEAAARDQPAANLATTLLLAIATPEQVAVGQIGDGAVVAQAAPGSFLALTRPQSGEYINETAFLTSTEGLAKAQYTVLRAQVSRLALFSDGLQMLALKMPEGTPYAPFFAPLLQFAASVQEPAKAKGHLCQFLQSSRITNLTDDDLTLLLAVRSSAPS